MDVQAGLHPCCSLETISSILVQGTLIILYSANHLENISSDFMSMYIKSPNQPAQLHRLAKTLKNLILYNEYYTSYVASNIDGNQPAQTLRLIGTIIFLNILGSGLKLTL